MSRGKWASRVWALKGRGRAEVARKRTDVGASTAGVRGREVRDGGSDGWGSRASERGRARARRKLRRQPGPPSSGRERGGERERGRDSAGRRSGAGAWADLWRNGVSHFPGISNVFSIYFL
jgi:hypothetical protein